MPDTSNNITLQMRRGTAVAVALGMHELAKSCASRRARFFYDAFASGLDRALSEGRSADVEVQMELNGEPVALEQHEDQQTSFPREPILFAGRWKFTVDPGTNVQRKEARIVAGTVWDFVGKAQAQKLPLPAGSIDWLSHSLPISAAVFTTSEYAVAFDTSRP